jgi:hypothetical protein
VTLPQQSSDSTIARRVDGRIVRGTREGPLPIANQWVVLHRVGPDASGPLDSIRTEAAGRYHLRYRTSGDSTALYFVSTSYGGVAYFTSPLRGPAVNGDDATITVFDTTSGPVAVKLGGRHVIVGALQPNGRRPIGEVYDLQNDSTVTLISRDSLSPVWTSHVPALAAAFQLNPGGDLAAGAVVRRGNSVGLFVPLSPGLRQMAFTYELPADAFPLRIPAEHMTGVFEVLVQEPSAIVTGPSLREMAPVSSDGRVFRRFLGRDIEPGSIVAIDLPRLIGNERQKVYMGVGIALLAAMAVALMFAARRRAPRTAPPIAVRPESLKQSRSESLLRAIAELDAEFERVRTNDPASRAAYDEKRAALKEQLKRQVREQLAAELAAEQRAT